MSWSGGDSIEPRPEFGDGGGVTESEHPPAGILAGRSGATQVAASALAEEDGVAERIADIERARAAVERES